MWACMKRTWKSVVSRCVSQWLESGLVVGWNTTVTHRVSVPCVLSVWRGVLGQSRRFGTGQYNTFHKSFEHIDRAILDGETEGFVKIHCRAGSDEILGATVVAQTAGDIISELTLAMQSKTGTHGCCVSV